MPESLKGVKVVCHKGRNHTHGYSFVVKKEIFITIVKAGGQTFPYKNNLVNRRLKKIKLYYEFIEGSKQEGTVIHQTLMIYN